MAPAAAASATPRITDCVGVLEGQEQQEPLRPVALLPKDWEPPELPPETAPGLRAELLTDDQSRARIRYGLSRGWTQRRIGEFAGRSATTVNKVKAALEAS